MIRRLFKAGDILTLQEDREGYKAGYVGELVHYYNDQFNRGRDVTDSYVNGYEKYILFRVVGETLEKVRRRSDIGYTELYMQQDWFIPIVKIRPVGAQPVRRYIPAGTPDTLWKEMVG